MVLNMGKEDLRGLSPGSVQPAGKPRPFLAHPRKSRPPPPARSPGAAWYPRVAGSRLRRSTKLTSALGL